MRRDAITTVLFSTVFVLGLGLLGCDTGDEFEGFEGAASEEQGASEDGAGEAVDETEDGAKDVTDSPDAQPAEIGLEEEAEALVQGLDLGGMSGNVRTYLTDAPGDYDEVWVTISRIEIHQNAEADSKWLTLVDEAQKHDLLTLQDAVTAVMGDANVEPGSYSQLRMIVDHASVVVDGEEHDLFIPSGAQTGIKINLHFTVEEDKDYVLVLDFDAAESIKKTGRGYLMEPVIAVEHIGYIGEDGEIVTVERRGDAEKAEGEDAEQAQTEGEDGEKIEGEGEDKEQAEGEDGEQAEGEDGEKITGEGEDEEHAEGEDGASGDSQAEGDGGSENEPTGGGELKPETKGDSAPEEGRDNADGKGGGGK